MSDGANVAKDKMGFSDATLEERKPTTAAKPTTSAGKREFVNKKSPKPLKTAVKHVIPVEKKAVTPEPKPLSAPALALAEVSTPKPVNSETTSTNDEPDASSGSASHKIKPSLKRLISQGTVIKAEQIVHAFEDALHKEHDIEEQKHKSAKERLSFKVQKRHTEHEKANISNNSIKHQHPHEESRAAESSSALKTCVLDENALLKPEFAITEGTEKVKKISLCGEVISIILAFFSVAMTTASYFTLSKTATHVEPVLRNWQQVPLLNVHLVQVDADCPEGSTTGRDTSMNWPGLASMGCACPTSSNSISSFDKECSETQLANSCINDAGVSQMMFRTWRGSKICFERGGQPVFVENWDGSVITRPNPDTEIPHQCPAGYRRCGRTSMDDWRATCTPEETECPVTLLASQSIFNYYGSLDQMTSLFENNQASRAYQPFLKQSSKAENLYLAESSLVVSKQLPLVEFTTAFMHPNNEYPYLGPCNQDVEVHDNIQSKYEQKASFSTADHSTIDFHHPLSCDDSGSMLDSRWKPYDMQDESDVLMENFLRSEECAGLPAGDFNTALSTNYFKSGTKCTTYELAPTAMQCSPDVPSGVVCNEDDPVCENTYYQSRCGRLMNILEKNQETSELKIGLFGRNEIYWKEECEAGYSQVKENNAPLQTAIQAIVGLLAVNVFMNLVTIVISVVVVIIWEFDIDLPCIDGGMKEDATFLKLLTEKIGGACKVVKLIPCIVALIYLSYVLDFYNEVAEKNCSDPTTNMNFNSVGATLPSSFTFCLVTLIMDVLHFMGPYIHKVYARWRGRVKPTPHSRISTKEEL